MAEIEVVGVGEEEEGGIGEEMEMEVSGGEEEAVATVIGMIDRGTLDGEEGVEEGAPDRLSGLRVAFFVFSWQNSVPECFRFTLLLYL